MTFIRLAPEKPGINFGLMRILDKEKDLTFNFLTSATNDSKMRDVRLNGHLNVKYHDTEKHIL